MNKLSEVKVCAPRRPALACAWKRDPATGRLVCAWSVRRTGRDRDSDVPLSIAA